MLALSTSWPYRQGLPPHGQQQLKRQRSFQPYDCVCQVCEPERSPSLTADSEPADDEPISDHVEPGFGIFDSGASGHAISAHELNQHRAEEPEAFTEIGESRRKVMSFGGGAQTFSLGVCTHSPSTGPMSHKPIEWDVSNNAQSNRPDNPPSTHSHCVGP